jgi:hypothetical protein
MLESTRFPHPHQIRFRAAKTRILGSQNWEIRDMWIQLDHGWDVVCHYICPKPADML